MAHLIQKSNRLQRKYRFWHNLAVISFCLCAACFLAWMGNIMIFRSFHPVFLGIVFSGFAVTGILTGFTFHKANGLHSGVIGERSLAQFVKLLPPSYCGFQNITVDFDGKESEIDMVIVGVGGVFVIEVKNHKGTIRGNYGDTCWTQEKIGRSGKPYETEFYSPVNEAGTQVYRLANFLRSHGASVFVEGAVYFSNRETRLSLTGERGNIPVYCAKRGGSGDMMHRILCSRKRLPPALVGQICQILNGQPLMK